MIVILRGLLLFGLFAVWIYSIVDVIRAPQEAVHYLHKLVWLALVILLNPIGPLAWLFLGRPVPIGSRLIPAPADHRPVAPDDSPEFLARLDEEIKRRRRADQLRKGPEQGPEQDRVDDEIKRLEDQFEENDEES